MFQIERQNKILNHLNMAQKANTEELASIFDVSKVTIRRDIDALAEKGLLIKTHGGAIAIKNTLLNEIPYSTRNESNREEKEKIGIMAADLIEDGDTIILDSGSTTLEIAKNIKQKNVTIITNDVSIVMELSHTKNKIIVCGGSLNSPAFSLIGNEAVEFFKKIHVNKTFLGCDALDLDFGVSNRTFDEVNIKRAMIRAAEKVIIVTDNSKLDKKVFCHLCDVSVFDTIVINDIDERYRKLFTEKDVNVITTNSQ